MQMSEQTKTSCPACGSSGATIDVFGYSECRRCGFYGNPKAKAKRDEFGDEIDYNERKADWAW